MTSLFVRLVISVMVLSAGYVRAAEGPDFAKAVAPILTKYCTGCHNDTDREGKLSLQSYEALLNGGEKGGVITAGQPDVSRLVRVLIGTAEPKMPPDGEQAPRPAEIEVLKAWIAAGAKGPSGAVADPVLVVPQIKLLSPPKLPINAVALSPDGQFLAVAKHGEVEVLGAADQTLLRKLSSIPGSVNDVAFSAAGDVLVVAAGEPGLFGEARVYQVADGRLAKAFRGHNDSLYCARLSPDGRLLATGGYDSAIKLWDVATGAEARALEGHNGPVFELAFRADGKVLASASGDRTVKLWNVGTGERLDTLKESQKELYCLAFNHDGTRLAAAGVDNRIRIWRISPEAKEETNSLVVSQFAHETPILRLEWSADGRTIASAGEDRLIKVWNADDMTIRQTLPRLSDWATGLAIGHGGDSIVAGCVDGSLSRHVICSARPTNSAPFIALNEVPPEVDYGPQPSLAELTQTAESEPNNSPDRATVMAVPGKAGGVLHGQDPQANGDSLATDRDLFRFDTKGGDQWILEVHAGRSKSPLDSKIEVLDGKGNPVPRLLLRAVRDSVIEFRGMTSEQRGVRLANWEEMLLNEYVYLSGDVIKLFQQRRGPDADAQFYPENGNRFAFFDTTSRSHALGEPAYIVMPYPVGTELPSNGLPVFTLNYENDDDGQRKLGKDSRLTFVAPADGSYLVRVSDVRGFSGDDYKYELTIRRPQPDFKVALATNNLTVNAGSGKPFTVKAERIDNYHGPVRVDIDGVPPGYFVTTPIEIQAGLYEANGLFYATAEATAPTDEQIKAIKFRATATVCGREQTKDVASFTALKLGDKPKVVAQLTPTQPEPTASDIVSIRPGGRVACNLRVERGGFADRIAFDVANLPHGVIVDDIGLSGVLIPEKQTERTIFLRAEPWVQAQTRTFFATAQVDGNQSSLPLVLRVVTP